MIAQVVQEASHHELSRRCKFHSASAELSALICIPPAAVSANVVHIVRRRRVGSSTEVAGELAAIVQELHVRVDVGFALMAAHWPSIPHVNNLLALNKLPCKAAI